MSYNEFSWKNQCNVQGATSAPASDNDDYGRCGDGSGSRKGLRFSRKSYTLELPLQSN